MVQEALYVSFPLCVHQWSHWWCPLASINEVVDGASGPICSWNLKSSQFQDISTHWLFFVCMCRTLRAGTRLGHNRSKVQGNVQNVHCPRLKSCVADATLAARRQGRHRVRETQHGQEIELHGRGPSWAWPSWGASSENATRRLQNGTPTRSTRPLRRPEGWRRTGQASVNRGRRASSGLGMVWGRFSRFQRSSKGPTTTTIRLTAGRTWRVGCY